MIYDEVYLDPKDIKSLVRALVMELPEASEEEMRGYVKGWLRGKDCCHEFRVLKVSKKFDPDLESVVTDILVGRPIKETPVEFNIPGLVDITYGAYCHSEEYMTTARNWLEVNKLSEEIRKGYTEDGDACLYFVRPL